MAAFTLLWVDNFQQPTIARPANTAVGRPPMQAHGLPDSQRPPPGRYTLINLTKTAGTATLGKEAKDGLGLVLRGSWHMVLHNQMHEKDSELWRPISRRWRLPWNRMKRSAQST